jgi:hypothetical protein
MKPHEERVVAEKADLDIKITALAAFVAREVYAGLPEVEQRILSLQLRYMTGYAGVLAMRIEAFQAGVV